MPEPLPPAELARGPRGPSAAELVAIGRVRPVLVDPDPMLRRRCEPVGQLDWPRLCRLAGDLLASMYAVGGRGLAAPQIGEPWRAFVMDAGWKEGAPRPRLILDPTLVALSGPRGTAVETCLSLPGRPVPVTRAENVVIEHFDLLGQALTLFLSGIEARIAQHEDDHLDGRLIVDLLAQDGALIAR